MKKTLVLLTLTILSISGFAQNLDSRVLVRNAGIVNGRQAISIKWYTKELYYPEGVILYRKEGGGEWQKLVDKPIKKQEGLSDSEYKKDQDLHFFVPLMAKREEIKGFVLINVLVKTFESEVFSKFIGIQYDDTTAIVGKRYAYKVTKVKGATETLIGETLPLTAGGETIEGPVQDITVKADTNKVVMKWRIELNRFYAVNIYKESANNDFIKMNATPVMISEYKDSLGRKHYPNVFFMDDSLNPGIYNYQLTGVDFFGKETKRSETFKAEVKDLIPPPPPEDLSDSINNLSVVLHWKNTISKDIAGVNVYRSVKSDGPFIKLNSSLLPLIANSYTDKVEKAGPYYYYVTSADAAGNESRSYTIFSEVHDIVPPVKPAGLIVKVDTGKIHLSWQKNKESDLMGYRIFRTINKEDKNNFILLNAEPIKENNFTDKLPKNAKNKFLYKVIAMDSSFNKSEASEVVSVQMPDIIPPVKPLLKRLTNTEQTILIEWIPNKDADLRGYDLYRSTNKGSYAKINKEHISLKETKYTDKNIESAAHYFYYLIAIDSANNFSQPSNVIEGYNNFGMLDSGPKDLKAKYREDKKDIHLSWKQNSPKEAFTYLIYKKEEGNPQMAPLSGQVKNNEYYDKDIKLGKSYYYEVRAFDKAGNIARSETVKITINQ